MKKGNYFIQLRITLAAFDRRMLPRMFFIHRMERLG